MDSVEVWYVGSNPIPRQSAPKPGPPPQTLQKQIDTLSREVHRQQTSLQNALKAHEKAQDAHLRALTNRNLADARAARLVVKTAEESVKAKAAEVRQMRSTIEELKLSLKLENTRIALQYHQVQALKGEIASHTSSVAKATERHTQTHSALQKAMETKNAAVINQAKGVNEAALKDMHLKTQLLTEATSRLGVLQRLPGLFRITMPTIRIR